VAGCHRSSGPKPKVVTSIFPVYDLARRVAGPDADVVSLVPTGVSVHLYNGTPHDMELATGARLAIMIGLGLDDWVQPMMERVSPKARLLRLGDRVPTLPRQPGIESAKVTGTGGTPDNDPHAGDSIDPHVWLDPQRAMLMATAIGEELARVDSSHANAYRERALELSQSLEALDHETEARTEKWKQRTFVTLHDAFQYYASRYHLEVAAVIQPAPGVRPKLHFDQLVLKRLRDRRAGGVFGEPQLESQPAHVLSQASRLPYGTLDPLGGGPTTSSYETLIRANTDALEGALAAEPAVHTTDASAAPSSSAAGAN
jgi:zinc transport system substrate-binding protein